MGFLSHDGFVVDRCEIPTKCGQNGQMRKSKKIKGSFDKTSSNEMQVNKSSVARPSCC